MVGGAGAGDSGIDDVATADENPIDVPRLLQAVLLAERIDDSRHAGEPNDLIVAGVAIEVAHQHGRRLERKKLIRDGAQLIVPFAVVAPIDVGDDDMESLSVRGPDLRLHVVPKALAV